MILSPLASVKPVTETTLSLSRRVRWVPNEDASNCMDCGDVFTFYRRKHHCRYCGNIYCWKCSSKQMPIPSLGYHQPVRVCEFCWEILNQGTKESSNEIEEKEELKEVLGDQIPSIAFSAPSNIAFCEKCKGTIDPFNSEQLPEKHQTPLHSMAKQGQILVIKYLIEKGNDINAVDDELSTPLHIAVTHGHLDVIQYLLQKGALPDPFDAFELTPLLRLFSQGISNRETIKHLQSITKCLLEAGANVNTRNNRGETILHLIAKHNESFIDQDFLQLLLHHGLNLNATNSSGKTALHLASICGNLQLIRLLVGYGCNVNAQDKHGNTPLHLLCNCQDELTNEFQILEGIKTLLTFQADIDLKNQDDLSPKDVCKNRNIYIFLMFTKITITIAS